MARRLTFHLIPHTHWDREWYLPRAQFQARLVSATASLLDLLGRDPGARFVLDGQTVLVEDALAVRPEWELPIARAAHGGRLDVGPWYILADELIPSGESLLRNLLEGSRDAALLGQRMDVLYSPDAFGHPASLPTLAAGFGIGAAVAWRGLGRPDGHDCDLYRWRGPDGSTLLLYHLPASGYEMGVDLLEPRGLAQRWRALRDAATARAATAHIAIFIGADHHAPPDGLSALVRRIERLEPNGTVRLSTLTEFFAAVSPLASAVPVISGEQRWSYGHTWTLQGVHSTRARLKRQHGGTELLLARKAEVLAALATWRATVDGRPLLRSAWRTLLQCQFHDTLCGCSSDAVAEEQVVRLRGVAAVATEVAREALHVMVGHNPDLARTDPARVSPSLLLWNAAARPRGGIVTAELTFFRRDVLVGPPSGRKPRAADGVESFELRDADGRRFPVQVLGVRSSVERIDAPRHYPDQDEVDRVRVAFVAPKMAGLALRRLVPKRSETDPRKRGLEMQPNGLSNRFVALSLSRRGVIALDDKRTGERFTNLLSLEDEHDSGDSYSPAISRGRLSVRSGATRILVEGPLVGALESRWSMTSPGAGTVDCRMIVVLHADSPIVRVRYELENHATNHRLRVRVAVGAGAAAVAGAAFGFERRMPVAVDVADFPAEHPVPTAPAHRYVAAGAGQRGLALLLPGFFEYEWTAKGDLAVTLLRAVGELSRGDLAARPGHSGWPMSIPGAQEAGRHIVEMALAPVGDTQLARPDLLEQLWEDVFLPIDATFLRDNTGTSRLDLRGIELQGSGLVFSAAKAAESGPGIVLRCYNTTDATVAGRWSFATPLARATLLRADETEREEIALPNAERVNFTAAPRELITIRVVPKRAR